MIDFAVKTFVVLLFGGGGLGIAHIIKIVWVFDDYEGIVFKVAASMIFGALMLFCFGIVLYVLMDCPAL